MKTSLMAGMLTAGVVAFLASNAMAGSAQGQYGVRGAGFDDGTFVVNEQSETPVVSPSDSLSRLDSSPSPTDADPIRVAVAGAAPKAYSVIPVGDGIRFHSSLRENLAISLCAVSGKIVVLLFSGIVEPSISYDFPLREKRLATGVYYCTMKSATKTVSVKLVLTR